LSSYFFIVILNVSEGSLGFQQQLVITAVDGILHPPVRLPTACLPPACRLPAACLPVVYHFTISVTNLSLSNGV